MFCMQAPDLSRLQGSLVLPTLRGMCISLAAEAVAHQQPPMQYVLRGAAEPAIAQLMKLAIGLQECRMLETSTCVVFWMHGTCSKFHPLCTQQFLCCRWC